VNIKLVVDFSILWLVKVVWEEAIKAKLNELPENLKKEVLDFIEFLLQKHKKKSKKGSLNLIGKVAYLS